MKIIDEEARAGFPRMRGARLHATIPISQDLIDTTLDKLPISVEIQEHNRIFIQYRAFRAIAEIVDVTPELTVVLSMSWLYRTALRGALAWKPDLHSYLAQRDKFVYVLCGRLPAVAKYWYWWRHLSEVQAQTDRGRMMLTVAAHIR